MKTNQPVDKKPITGLVKEYFTNGELSNVGRYANGEKTGQWKFYFRNGGLRAIGKLSNGQFTGLWKWYRENGRRNASSIAHCRRTAPPRRGARDWGSRAGKLLQVGKFENNKQVGLWKRYHASGELMDVGKYIDGERTGEWKFYDAGGKLRRTRTFTIKPKK
jgi:antitoxin component YwqK of YwqJK toxin-antitoxin module